MATPEKWQAARQIASKGDLSVAQGNLSASPIIENTFNTIDTNMYGTNLSLCPNLGRYWRDSRVDVLMANYDSHRTNATVVGQVYSLSMHARHDFIC